MAPDFALRPRTVVSGELMESSYCRREVLGKFFIATTTWIRRELAPVLHLADAVRAVTEKQPYILLCASNLKQRNDECNAGQMRSKNCWGRAPCMALARAAV